MFVWITILILYNIDICRVVFVTDDALNQVAEERQKTFMAKKNFREDINKVNKKTNDKVLDMKNRMQFWQIVSIGTLIVGFLIGWIL